jgi:hypothetical protein
MLVPMHCRWSCWLDELLTTRIPGPRSTPFAVAPARCARSRAVESILR